MDLREQDLFGSVSTCMRRLEVSLVDVDGLVPSVVVTGWPQGRRDPYIMRVNVNEGQSVGTVLGLVGKLLHAYYRTPKAWREMACHTANVLGRQGYEVTLR